MSAEELRFAAELMRARAEAATPGDWRTSHCAPSVWSDRDPAGVDAFHVAACHDAVGQTTEGSRRDAEHIASWHPAVALAVADLLDLAACHEPRTGDNAGQGYLRTGGYGVVDPSCSTCGTPDEYAEPWPCQYATRALAVARAYMDGAP